MEKVRHWMYQSVARIVSDAVPMPAASAKARRANFLGVAKMSRMVG